MALKSIIIVCLCLCISFSFGNDYYDPSEIAAIKEILRPHNLLNLESKQTSHLCGLALLSYLGALSKFHPWALQMFDSTAKIPEGILYANHEFLGQYDECLAVVGPNGTFRGQHCTLEGELHASLPGIPASQKSIFFYGLCIPSVCTVDDLNKVLSNVGDITKDLLTIQARENYCHTSDKQTAETRAGDWVVVIFLLLLAVFGCFSTLYDYVNISNNQKPHPLLASFSLYSNGKALFEIKEARGQIQCLNGIRAMSMLWIVFFHTFTSIVAAPVVNLVQAFSDRTTPLYSVLASAYLAVDSFLLMSGFLLATSFFKTMHTKGTYDVPMGYIHRYFRVTPSYAMVLLFQVTLLRYIGDGPMWSFISDAQVPVCEKYWWSGLLYVQNYVNPDELCLTQTWYLSADMQLYWISPLLLYPMWKWRKLAPALISLVILVFSFLPFALAYTYDLAPIALMDKTGDQNRIDNYPTHSRAVPWLVGVALAYVVFNRKDRDTANGISSRVTTYGWILAFLLSGLSLFGLLAFEPYGPHTWDASFYLVFHRLGWSLAVAWLIYACLYNKGGAINGFLSWNIFQPLAKLSYGVYLTHVTVIFYRIGIFRTNIIFNLPELYFMGISIWVTSHFVAILLFLFIEAPFSNIEGYVLKKAKILPLPRPKS